MLFLEIITWKYICETLDSLRQSVYMNGFGFFVKYKSYTQKFLDIFFYLNSKLILFCAISAVNIVKKQIKIFSEMCPNMYLYRFNCPRSKCCSLVTYGNGRTFAILTY